MRLAAFTPSMVALAAALACASCSRAPVTTPPSLSATASASSPATVVAAGAAAAPAEARDARPFALVELFTSEGCSSCPPADAVLRQLADDARTSSREVYALSFHVDYWNEIGWVDRFSQAAFSARQRAYANARRERSVYTPQLVVNGREELNGSDASGARRAIDHALHGEPSHVALTLSVSTPTPTPTPTPTRETSDAITVRFSTEGAPSDALLFIALVEPSASSEVTRGENAGRRLDHANVVRALDEAPLDAPSGVRTVVLPDGMRRASMEVVGWVQLPRTMQVVAASRARAQ
jgi:hypothetical protein